MKIKFFNRKNLKISLISLLILIFLFFLLFDAISIHSLKNHSENLIVPLDYPIMRIVFFGKSEDAGIKTLSAKFSILDFNGSEVSVIERSWKSDALELVFKKVRFGKKVFYFPQKIYGMNYDSFKNSWKTENSGINLVPYYLENGQCLLYNSVTKNDFAKKLYKIADFAFTRISIFSKKYCSQEKIMLTNFNPAQIYNVVINGEGELEILE